MTELTCWPLDNKEYTAEALGAAYAARSRGILHAADFTATANGDNTLTIGPGVGCIHPGTYWAAFPYLLANTQLTFTDADGTNPRWDAVALTYDKNTNTAGLEVRTGTASASPALPELRRDDDYDEIFLYRVTRPRGATKISADNIVDLRLDSTYCGLMRDTMDSVDTGVMNAAFTAFLQQIEAELARLHAGTAVMTKGEYDPAGLSLDVAVQLYNCTKSGKVYALKGTGAVGRFKVPAAWSAGDTWTVNGKAVPAYCGADAADGDSVVAGRWVLFTFDGSRLDFNGGGGLSASKLAQATATEGNVLAGNRFYSGSKTIKEGSMPNRGSWGVSLAPGDVATVPSGYHNGSGKVKAKNVNISLAGTYYTTAASDLNWRTTVSGANALLVIVYGSDMTKINVPTVSSGTVTKLSDCPWRDHTDGGPHYHNAAFVYAVTGISGDCTVRCTTNSWDWGFGATVYKIV